MGLINDTGVDSSVLSTGAATILVHKNLNTVPEIFTRIAAFNTPRRDSAGATVGTMRVWNRSSQR